MQEKIDAVIERLFATGVHYGYSRTRRHPKMLGHVLTTKNGTDIINVEHTKAELDIAKEFVKGISAKGGIVLWVATKPEARAVVERIAQSTNMPYVTERWIGGTFTNWTEIKKRINRMEDLRGKREKQELDMYTKKERLMIDREIGKLTKFFGGLSGLAKLPDAIIVIDPKEENIAVTEATLVHIPVVALLNTDCDPRVVTYPIAGNDASRSSITYIAESLEEAWKAGILTTSA